MMSRSYSKTIKRQKYHMTTQKNSLTKNVENDTAIITLRIENEQLRKISPLYTI